ncbi:MAG: hypothetical protein JXR88_04415 [Clostridia bacterium]|nr:hypothetical protein [Clostridia bacterium]
MKIGIDIDGTITTPFYWLDFYNLHLNKNVKPKDITTYDHHIPFGITLQEFKRFRDENLFEIHNLAVPRNACEFYMRMLFFDNHELSLITAREKELETLTNKWLMKYNLYFHQVYHLGHTEKAHLALHLNLDVFIEDRLETAIALIQYQIPVILFTTPYNQGYKHPLLFRVNSWQEVYQIIKTFKSKRHIFEKVQQN